MCDRELSVGIYTICDSPEGGRNIIAHPIGGEAIKRHYPSEDFLGFGEEVMNELKQHYDGLKSVAIHPGNVRDSCAEPMQDQGVLSRILAGMEETSGSRIGVRFSDEVINFPN